MLAWSALLATTLVLALLLQTLAASVLATPGPAGLPPELVGSAIRLDIDLQAGKVGIGEPVVMTTS